MVFLQQISRGGTDGEVLCEAVFRIVCLADSEFRPTAIPGFLLEQIKDVS